MMQLRTVLPNHRIRCRSTVSLISFSLIIRCSRSTHRAIHRSVPVGGSLAYRRCELYPHPFARSYRIARSRPFLCCDAQCGFSQWISPCTSPGQRELLARPLILISTIGLPTHVFSGTGAKLQPASAMRANTFTAKAVWNLLLLIDCCAVLDVCVYV